MHPLHLSILGILGRASSRPKSVHNSPVQMHIIRKQHRFQASPTFVADHSILAKGPFHFLHQIAEVLSIKLGRFQLDSRVDWASLK